MRKAQLKSLLWVWAGVDPGLLENAQPLTQWRYTWLGLLLTFIFLFCFFSGLFAFEWVFGQPAVSMGFAVFWALVVYNLYRFLLSTVNNGLVPGSSNGGPQFLSLLIRYGFLVFLAMIISKPIELYWFSFWVERGTLDGAFNPNQLGEGMAVLHREFPFTWAFTAISVSLFLWPFLLKRSFAKSCSYEQKRAEVEMEIILKDYQRFNERYLAMMAPYGVTSFNGGANSSPFEKDPPSERVFHQKGTLIEWAKNHIQKQ